MKEFNISLQKIPENPSSLGKGQRPSGTGGVLPPPVPTVPLLAVFGSTTGVEEQTLTIRKNVKIFIFTVY